MIRRATPADAGALIEMGRAFHIESGWAQRLEGMESENRPALSFNPLSFAKTLENLAATGTLLVAEEGDQVVGMVGAVYWPAFWNEDLLLAQEIFWYVSPSHRPGKVVGGELLTRLEAEAAGRKAAFLGMVAEHGVRSEALARFFRARRYSPVEHTFCKGL